MKYLIIICLLVLSNLSASAQTVTEWTATQVNAKLKSNPNAILLDVRTAGEFADGHIAKSVNIDVNAPGFDQKILKLDKNKPVYVYCTAGVRSKKAAGILKQKGFNAISMSGGINSWTAEGFPVTKGN